MKEREVSIQGQVIRDIIAHMSSSHLLGKSVRVGQLRKRLAEPPWKCPDDCVLTEVTLEHCTGELFAPFDPDDSMVLLQLHGGGYVGGLRNIYRNFAKLYSELGNGMPVFSVDYRLAPEHPYPAAFRDAIAGFDWLLAHGWTEDQILVAGDSAGGGLALALCLYLKNHDRKLPAGIIAMSPWTDLTASGSSYTENFTRDPIFGNTFDSLVYNRDYVQIEPPTNPYISPVFGDFEGFPPMLIQVGRDEMLLSDSVDVAQKAKEKNVKVRLSIYEGMFHVFQMALQLLPESRKAWEEVRRFIWIMKKGRSESADERAEEL